METFSALLAICEGNPLRTGGFLHKDQRRGVLIFSLICAWTSGWANNRHGDDLRRHSAHYDVTVALRISVYRHIPGYCIKTIIREATRMVGVDIRVWHLLGMHFNTLGPRQNNRQFVNGNEYHCTLIQLQPKCVLDQIYNKWAFFSGKSFAPTMRRTTTWITVVQLTDACICL